MSTTDLVLNSAEASVPAVLFRSAEPEEIVRQASAVARALAPVIEDRRLYTEINGRRHVRVEGWTLLGSMLGVFPVCVWSRELADGQGWEARVEARTLGGALVGAAEASCMRDEPNWRDKPDYALRSMSQTRATSKALRLPLGFVVALAGYEVTPAEEADGARTRISRTGTGQSPLSTLSRSSTGSGEEIPPATEPQIRAIYAIGCGGLGMEDGEVDALALRRYGAAPAALNRRQASELIDALKSRPRE